MANESQQNMQERDAGLSTDSATSSHSEAESDQLASLRALLLRDDRQAVSELEATLEALGNRLDNADCRADEASEILPRAVKLSQKKSGDLGEELKPIIVEQFQHSTRENPEIMAEALFPILGPAIRKMIVAMITPDKNKTKRKYKFEQLFLIEKETGIPICHASSSSAEAQDADMVSGMLSAIQSFVQDAFQTQEFDSLNTLQLGDLSVWIEWGPTAVVAAVIRGVAPERCRTALQTLLEDVHRDYHEDLTNYQGDSEPFSPLKSEFLLFMDNHDSRLRNRVRQLTPNQQRNLFIASLVGSLFLVWLVVNQFDKRNWNRFVNTLDAEPGIVVTQSNRGWRSYSVRGMLDSLATDPAILLAESGIDASKVQFSWEPYQATDPSFTLQRARTVLVPPPGVTLELDGNTLIVSGVKSASWLEDAKRLIRGFPEITTLKNANDL